MLVHDDWPMRLFGPPILFVAMSITAAALAHLTMRRQHSQGLLPLCLAGLAALWAIFVTTLTTLPFWGDYPSHAEAWAARSLVAITCGAWLMAAMLRHGATRRGRTLATGLAMATLAFSGWLIGG